MTTDATAAAALEISLFLLGVQRSGGTVTPESYNAVLEGVIFNQADKAPEPERSILTAKIRAKMRA